MFSQTLVALLWLLVASVLYVPVVKAVKRKAPADSINTPPSEVPTPSSSHTQSPALIASLPPNQRSLDQWNALPAEALHLYANALFLQTSGPPDQIAAALYNHYQSSLSSSASAPVSSTLSDRPAPSHSRVAPQHPTPPTSEPPIVGTPPLKKGGFEI